MPRRKRIWLDGQCLQTASRRRGVGRYVADLFSSIARDFTDIELVMSFNSSLSTSAIAARDQVSSWVAPENLHLWQGVAQTGEVIGGLDDRRRFSEIALRHHVECLDVDLAVATSPFEGAADCAVPFLPEEKFYIPATAIFYDAIPLRFPEQYLPTSEGEAFWRRRLESLRFSTVNLCISAFGESELRAFLPEARTLNIKAGIAASVLSGAGRTIEPTITHKPFALYVGGLDWRKNVSSIVEAFSALSSFLKRESALVIAGDNPPDRLNELRDKWRDGGLPAENFICLGHVPDSDLRSLLQRARVVVQPSHMEGFGLVVAEAVACGAPVLASRISAFLEVLGEDENMFDPTRPDELSHRLEKFLANEAYALNVARQQKKRVGHFSWERSAQLAAGSMMQVATAHETIRSSLKDVRLKTLEALEKISLPPAELARTLALAEPDEIAPKRLIVDATQVARLDRGTGIQRVVKSICANLPDATAHTNCEVVISAFAQETGWFAIRGEEKSSLSVPSPDARKALRFGVSDTVLMLDSSWEFWGLYASSLLGARMRGAEIVACLYDLVPIKMPAYCDPGMPGMFAAWLKSALQWSTAVICISRAVADELLTMLDALDFPRPMRVGYWRLGANFLADGSDREIGSVTANGSRPRFLMVGTLEPRKGHAVALEAFQQFWMEGGDADLTIVGNYGWGVDSLIDTIQSHPEYGSRLFWRQYVSDEELRQLYRSCDSLIAASHGEGFGLPIVEAARYGKHVMASDIPVFHEVSECSASVSFFEAGSPTSLANEIRSWLLRRQQSDPVVWGSQRAWPDWAESTVELTKVILERGWYKTYQPSVPQTFVDPLDIGKVMMDEPIPMRERRYKAELISGPIDDRKHDAVRYTVRLANLSDRTWSSLSRGGTNFGIHVAIRTSDRPSRVARASLPFILEPGGTCVLSLEKPKSWPAVSNEQLEFGVFQEGVGWW